MAMQLFSRVQSLLTPMHQALHGVYQRIITLVDFLAALSFVIGSVLFFDETLQPAGTWLFLIGSIFFCLSPTLKVVREFHLAQLPDGLAQPPDERLLGSDGR